MVLLLWHVYMVSKGETSIESHDNSYLEGKAAAEGLVRSLQSFVQLIKGSAQHLLRDPIVAPQMRLRQEGADHTDIPESVRPGPPAEPFPLLQHRPHRLPSPNTHLPADRPCGIRRLVLAPQTRSARLDRASAGTSARRSTCCRKSRSFRDGAARERDGRCGA